MSFKYFKNNLFSLFFFFVAVLQMALFFHLQGQTLQQGEEKLRILHSKLQLKHGSFGEEYPEQLLAATYIPKNAKVLELGGNVGRNSCIIASLLSDSKHLVVIEPGEGDANCLMENRNLNNLNFHIEKAAVSKVPLIQSGWKTIPSNEVLPGYTRINTITFAKLQKKYAIKFDTLVVDCEGALYYILKDDPTILKNIKLIIIENDFDQIEQMSFVHDLFKKYGIECAYNQAGGWGACYEYFYQVWKKG